MKKYFKNFLILAVILAFAIIVVPLTSEHGERSEETFNTNFSNNFNINTDFLGSAASSIDLIGTGMDIFVMTWTNGEPSLITITLTQPYHIDVMQGLYVDNNNNLLPDPLGYGYLARGVKEVTFRLPHNLEHENGDIYVIVYSEVGVNYGVHKAIDYTGYEKNFLLITDAYHEPQNSDQITKSQTVNADGSYSDDFVSYYINREMSPFDTVSPYGATILPYDVCSMLQIFDYTRFEYGVTFTSEQGEENYIGYLRLLINELRYSNLCDGIIAYCLTDDFYAFANVALEQLGGEFSLYTCILKDETYDEVPESSNAYISGDMYSKGYAIGYEFVKGGVENNQFIVGTNDAVFVIPTDYYYSGSEDVLRGRPLLESGIIMGIDMALSDLDFNESLYNIDYRFYYCESSLASFLYSPADLFSRVADEMFGANRHPILAHKAFYNFIGNFDLTVLNECAREECANGLIVHINVFYADATFYCYQIKKIIKGDLPCPDGETFDTDVTSAIGLNKVNSLVTIFARYIMGKTGNQQYATVVEDQDERSYYLIAVGIGGTCELYGYYIDYVTRRIAM